MRAKCCIAGGGPAGMMLGLLLARAGVDVVVLEKHEDFLRDFRGDTIHPSTLEVMHELGLLDEFLELPHQKADSLFGQIGTAMVRFADFSHLPTRCRFIAFMPQWDFLDFLADHARRYPSFRLLMEAEATDLLWEGERVAGVVAQMRDERIEIRADLVVGADGRHSITRQKAGMEVIPVGAPMDVLWMRISRRASDPDQTFGRIEAGRMFVTINRGDYWQCAYLIPKGAYAAVQEKGLDAFRADIARLASYLADRVGELASWSEIKLLTVAVDRLRRWHRPGFLCIGDAAHAMSPVGGVGINLAIQDAVAAANILSVPLRNEFLTDDDLRQVQKRREWPTRATQALQVFIQNRIISRVLNSKAPIEPPWPVRLAQRWPVIQRIPARLIGVGIRPEHVSAPETAVPAKERAHVPVPPPLSSASGVDGVHEVYRPRRFESRDTWKFGDKRFKPILVSHVLDRPPFASEPETVAAARTYAEMLVPEIDRQGGHFGLGYVVLHQGKAANWLLFHWWISGDIACQILSRSSHAEPKRFERVVQPYMACVWEALAIAHERDAWVSTMMAGRPDAEAYLATRMSPGEL